jgi:hypothetical protein
MSFLDRIFGPPGKEKFARMLLSAVVRAGEKDKVVYDESENRLQLDNTDGFQFIWTTPTSNAARSPDALARASSKNGSACGSLD